MNSGLLKSNIELLTKRIETVFNIGTVPDFNESGSIYYEWIDLSKKQQYDDLCKLRSEMQRKLDRHEHEERLLSAARQVQAKEKTPNFFKQ